MRVKICGVTSERDALAAVEAGADAIGVNFIPSSPRRVTVAQARRIAEGVPPFVAVVGVVADLTPPRMADLVAECRLHALQLHGEESPSVCDAVRAVAPVIKAIRVQDRRSVRKIYAYRHRVDAILLDTYQPDQLGGTGRVFDWRLAMDAKRYGVPILLSGGLTPVSVSQAIRRVHPYGVDVASGVECSPGRKDAAKIRAFVKAAHAAGFR